MATQPTSPIATQADNQFSYKKVSLYKLAMTYGEKRLNLDYDYTDTVMSRTLSAALFRNPILATFLVYVNDYVVNLINAVKKVKISRNYTVPKDYQYIN